MTGKRLKIAGVVLSAGGLLLWFWFSLPSPLFDVPYSAVLTDREGKLLSARVAGDGQWRFPQGRDVPEKFATALVSFEDRRFYYHLGVDPISIVRALWDNARARRIVSGASTLTMQVVRMARGFPRRTLPEKMVEAVLAFRLELSNSKKEILSLYSAHAPFGGNVVGLEAAAWRYFGRAPEQLSWAESAALAVLPNAPGIVHPGRSRKTLRHRRDALLFKLHRKGYLKALDYQLAISEPLPQKPRPLPAKGSVLLGRLAAQNKNRAFRITVDGLLQSRVEKVLARHKTGLQAAGIYNAAILIVDNRTLEIPVYVGNTGRPGMEGHGYAMDLVQTPRSTGSLLKPFLFAAMLEQGELQPESLVADVPVQIGGFRPENFDESYRGAVTARVALAQSLNIPAALLLSQHGVARFQAMLNKMGMRTLFRTPDEYGLSLILGGSEGTLFDLTTMYANLARLTVSGKGRNNAWLMRPTLFYGRPPEEIGKTPIGSAAAWLTLEALVEVNRPGAEQFWRNFVGNRRIAWKTGTSYGLRDGWAVGTTRNYTVGIWTGNATGEGRAGLTGKSAAAPILFDVFGLLQTGDWFSKPTHRLKTLEVCNMDGNLPSNGCAKKTIEIPENAHFNRISKRHRWIHLDSKAQWRVHSGCESVSNMRSVSWFVLPPVQEYYFRQHNAAYRTMPDWRPDCGNPAVNSEKAFEIVYPHRNSGVYIPIDFGNRRGRVVLQAIHRVPETQLFWHIDGKMIATTRLFHNVAVDLVSGRHRLTIVDQNGERRSQTFLVHGLKDGTTLTP